MTLNTLTLFRHSCFNRVCISRLISWVLAVAYIHVCVCLLGVLDLFLNFPAFLRWTFSDVMRNILKIVVSLAWSLLLPVCYLHQNNSLDFNKIKNVLSLLNQVKGIPPLYLLAVGLYLLPNVLAAVLFMFPILLRSIENSDYLIIRLLLWWSQVLLFNSTSKFNINSRL